MVLPFGIWADVAAAPGDQLDQAQTTTPGVDAHFNIDLDPGAYVDVAADDHVWIGFQADATLSIRRPNSALALDSLSVAAAYASGLPDPYGSGSFTATYMLRFKIWTNP